VAIESVDLANCYDAVAHPIASFDLRSFKVCKVIVAIMLYVLESMTWYLKTAFGQSKISFVGTDLDPSMGLGQGKGAAPPGFLAVCTLMINVYRNLGHGVTFIGALARDAFTLAAVLFVDDSDLFHMAIGMPLDEDFFADSSECNQQLGRTGSRDRGVAQTTEMLLVHAWLGMEEGQGMPQDPL
jgi:hypothetical protein